MGTGAPGAASATAYKWRCCYDDKGRPRLVGRWSTPTDGRIRPPPSAIRPSWSGAERFCTVGIGSRDGNGLTSLTSTEAVALRGASNHQPPKVIGWSHGVPAAGTARTAATVRDRPSHRTITRYRRELPAECLYVDVKKQGRIPDGGSWRLHGRGSAAQRSEERRVDGRKRGRLNYDHLHASATTNTRCHFGCVLADASALTPACDCSAGLVWVGADEVSHAVERGASKPAS